MTDTLTNAAAKLKCAALKRSRHATLPAARLKQKHMPALWWITDGDRVADPRPILPRLPPGSGVILRHYGDPNRSQLAADLAELCRRHRLVFVVASTWRLAAQSGAHGLHLPEHQTRRGPEPGARLWVRAKQRVLLAAAHNALSLRRAARLRAAAVLLAPVFKTASHPERTPLGVLRLARMRRALGCAVIALGGVDAKTAPALAHGGFAGIAGIGFGLSWKNRAGG